MGQEPYTLIMLMAEHWPRELFQRVELWATDYEDTFADIVTTARYPVENLKRVPPELLQRYSKPSGDDHHTLEAVIRERLRFQLHDLLTLQPAAPSFAGVLCKNVLLHFLPPQRVDILRMFHHALAPNGLLATEQTQKLPAAVKPLFRQLSTDTQVHEKV